MAYGRKKSRGRGRKGHKRSRLRSDGLSTQVLSAAHGRTPKRVPGRRIAAIRKALSPVSTVALQTFQVQSGAVNTCSYVSYQIGNSTDIAACINNSGSVTVGDNGKLLIDNGDFTAIISNQESVACNVRIYEYVCRRDTPQPSGDTQAILNSGFADEVTYNAVTSTTIGGTLFNNSLFCSYYKIVNVRTATVPSGKDLKLTMSLKSPKWVNPLTFNGADVWCHRNYTRGFVVQAWGHLGDGGGADPNTVAVGKHKLISYLQKRMHLSASIYSVAGTFLQPLPAGPANVVVMDGDMSGIAIADLNV